MKRTIPVIITFVVGMLVIISEFVPHKPFGSIAGTLESWFLIIAGFAIILGVLSLLRMSGHKIKSKAPNWQYYLAGIISFSIMVSVGALWGMRESRGILGNGEILFNWLGAKPFDYLFNNFFIHLSATMFSLLAFYIASAAYRAFIIRSFESNLLMITAVIIMLGRTSLGNIMTGWLPQNMQFLHLPRIADYIMIYPNSAAQRAIMISAALGVIGSSLRIILGIERSYLGGGK